GAAVTPRQRALAAARASKPREGRGRAPASVLRAHTPGGESHAQGQRRLSVGRPGPEPVQARTDDRGGEGCRPGEGRSALLAGESSPGGGHTAAAPRGSAAHGRARSPRGPA